MAKGIVPYINACRSEWEKGREVISTFESISSNGVVALSHCDHIAETMAQYRLACQQSRQQFELTLAQVEKGLVKFREVREKTELRLEHKLKLITNLNEALASLAQSAVYTQRDQEVLALLERIIEREHQAYFAEMDRLLSL